MKPSGQAVALTSPDLEPQSLPDHSACPRCSPCPASRSRSARRGRWRESHSLLNGARSALIGENGAGKSTLMKVLSGGYRPDAGSMTVDGKPYAPVRPAARLAGVAMIYQELNLRRICPSKPTSCSGRSVSRRGWLNRASRSGSPATPLLGSRSRPADWRRPSALLPIAEAAVGRDRPSNRLRCEDPDLRRADQLADGGRHGASVCRDPRLAEARNGDRLHQPFSGRGERNRRGVYRASRRPLGRGGPAGRCHATRSWLGQWSAGKSTNCFPNCRMRIGAPLLEVRGFERRGGPAGGRSCHPSRRDLGIAGLVGAGRSELVRAIFGLDTVRSGMFASSTSGRWLAARGRASSGLGLVSEDRKAEGLALAAVDRRQSDAHPHGSL